MNLKATARQIELGEFGDHHGDLAHTMTAAEFAARFGVEVIRCVQDCVTVKGIDYYWSATTGRYDGWGRGMQQ